jgi:hypothetical protein
MLQPHFNRKWFCQIAGQTDADDDDDNDDDI